MSHPPPTTHRPPRWLLVMTVMFGHLAIGGCEPPASKTQSQTESVNMTQPTNPKMPPAKTTEAAAVRYLVHEKHWSLDDFRIEKRGPTEDGRCEIIWGIFLEDEKNPVPGGGQSVELHVDLDEYRVVKELGFQ